MLRRAKGSSSVTQHRSLESIRDGGCWAPGSGQERVSAQHTPQASFIRANQHSQARNTDLPSAVFELAKNPRFCLDLSRSGVTERRCPLVSRHGHNSPVCGKSPTKPARLRARPPSTSLYSTTHHDNQKRQSVDGLQVPCFSPPQPKPLPAYLR